MKPKALFILILIFTLLVLSLLFKNGGVALIALPFLIYLMSGVVCAPGSLKFEALRELEKTTISTGETVEMRLLLTNLGRDLDNVFIKDWVHPHTVVEEGQSQRHLSMPGGGKIELKYQLTADRGNYTWKDLTLFAEDIFGLITVREIIPASGHLLVMPRMEKLRHIPLRPGSTLHTTGSIPARIAGSGIDFWGVREYQPGDSFQQLNWRKSARYPQKLFTKQFEQEEIMDVGLVLDTRIPPDLSVESCSYFEYLVTVTASLAEAFLREGNRVGLLLFGQKPVSLFPGYGKSQLIHILRNLAGVGVSPELSFSHIEILSRRLFPGRTQMVIVSPVNGEDERAYAYFRRADTPVLLISPDPAAFQASTSGKNQLDAVALHAASLSRLLNLQRLRQMGVRVVDWPVEEPLSDHIQTTLSRLR
jgi:uncharacterized protein (DUF58 family)